jgi:hypothetical protein
MATKRGENGGKPAAATEGVATDDQAQDQTQTSPQEAVAGEGAAADGVSDAAGLTAALAQITGERDAALAIIDKLTAANADLAERLAQAEVVAEPVPTLEATDKLRAAAAVGVSPTDIMAASIRDGRVCIVTRDGRKLVKAL